MGNIAYKIGCTPEELEQSLRLRFEVFHLEIKGEVRAPNDTRLDHDKFDDVCEHLIIVDTKTNLVVGTYRMLLDSVAKKNFGFYSETKFNIESIKRLEGRSLEVGRSCVQKEYRDKSVLNLLWQGICQYTVANGVRYIFGSANIMTEEPHVASEFFAMFKAAGLFKDLGVRAVDKRHKIELDENITVENPKKLFNALPTLFKGYMSVGLKVCGYPSLGDFGGILFPVILDIKDMSKSYKRRFFGNYLEER